MLCQRYKNFNAIVFFCLLKKKFPSYSYSVFLLILFLFSGFPPFSFPVFLFPSFFFSCFPVSFLFLFLLFCFPPFSFPVFPYSMLLRFPCPLPPLLPSYPLPSYPQTKIISTAPLHEPWLSSLIDSTSLQYHSHI